LLRPIGDRQEGTEIRHSRVCPMSLENNSTPLLLKSPTRVSSMRCRLEWPPSFS
jgi:hypothetical protein